MEEITGLTTSWLATRTGVQPARIDALRRSGELLGVRRADGQHVFPSWQFDRDLRPLPALPSLVAAAREAGIDERRLHELVMRRAGLIGNRRVTDILRAPGGEGFARTLVGNAT